MMNKIGFVFYIVQKNLVIGEWYPVEGDFKHNPEISRKILHGFNAVPMLSAILTEELFGYLPSKIIGSEFRKFKIAVTGK
jgi:hypothetical protein